MNSKIKKINSLHLHFVDSQTDGPTLVLMPGLTANCQAFDGLVAAGITKFCRLIAIDLRGRGLSDKPDTGYDMPSHAADVWELLDSENIRQPILGGHSFGGLLTIYMSVQKPDFQRGVVLLDAAARLHPLTKDMLIPALARIGQTYASWTSYLEQIKKSPYLTFWDAAMESYYRADLEFLWDGQVRQRSKPAHIVEAIQKGSFGEDWPRLIPQIQVPALLVNGVDEYALGAPLLPPDLAKETVHKLPLGTYVGVSGNHQTMLYGKGADETVVALQSFFHQNGWH